jgi:CheY-like chemotaxis protein/predicted  nucleic acid-binding Zn-ribbon protein
VADQPAAPPPSFADLLKQGQAFLSTLEALDSKAATDAADHHAEVARLGEQIAAGERQLGDLREAQRELSMDRDRLGADINRLHEQLDAVRRQGEEASRMLQEERKGLLARHEEELADLHQRLTAREAALEQARAELRQAQEQIDAQLETRLSQAADQQKVTDQLEELRSLYSAMQVEHRNVKNQLTQAKADVETMEGYQMQWAAEREELLTTAATRKEEYEKLNRGHAELIAQATKFNSEASARRQALTTEIQQLNKELNEAMSALARQQERDRQREKSTEALRESWQREKTELEIAVRDARLAASGGPVTPEHLYALKTDLNTITGFSALLQQETGNAITPEERLEYLRHINQSAERFARELRELSSVGSPDAAGAAPEHAGWRREMPEILIADADADARERIEPFLSRAGYRVAVATSATDAMDQALREKPIAVVIDSALPPAGGAQLIEDLRRERRTRDVPVVLTSQDPNAAALLNGAPVEFMPKPIDRQRLLQLLVKLDLLAEDARAKKMPGTILVVDDDRQHIRLVRATLKPFKVTVLSAENGTDGIAMATEHQPDLIVLDLMMPGVDGYQVIDALRAEPTTSGIPILVYTAKTLPAEERDTLAAKVQSILQKGDFNKDRLLELIQKRGERRGRARTPSADTAA